MPEHPGRRTPWAVWIAIPLILAFIYFFPRLLIAKWGEADPWTSYFYLYGLGLIFFLIGIWVILSQRACQFGRGRDSFWFAVLLVGFLFFVVVHAVWIVAAQRIPYLGG